MFRDCYCICWGRWDLLVLSVHRLDSEKREGFCHTASRHSCRICRWGDGTDKVAFVICVCAVNSRLLPWMNKVVLKAQSTDAAQVRVCTAQDSAAQIQRCPPCPQPRCWVPVPARAPAMVTLRLPYPSGTLAPAFLSPSWSWESPWSTLNQCRINSSFAS